MAKRPNTLGVDWSLPGQKRRFATSTVASSNLIVLLSESGGTVKEVHDLINFDDEAKAILQHFIDNGYSDTVLNTLVR